MGQRTAATKRPGNQDKGSRGPQKIKKRPLDKRTKEPSDASGICTVKRQHECTEQKQKWSCSNFPVFHGKQKQQQQQQNPPQLSSRVASPLLCLQHSSCHDTRAFVQRAYKHCPSATAVAGAGARCSGPTLVAVNSQPHKGNLFFPPFTCSRAGFGGPR